MSANTSMLTRVVVVALATALLSGCGMFPWLGGDKDPHPPTPINKKLPQQVAIRTLWKKRVGKGTSERELRLVPAVVGGRVYAADAGGRIVALSSQDGRTLWERKTKLPFSGGPVVQGETLVIGSSNGDLLALSTRDGNQRWRAQLGSEVLSLPLIVGDLVVAHTIDDTVYGIALADGSERWRYNYPAPVLTLHGSSSPVAAGDGVIVGFSGGRLVYLDLKQGIPLWERTITSPRGRSELDRIADIDADPIVVGGIAHVATYNGDLAAVEIASGSILWRRALSAHAGLSADATSLYITDSDDIVWAADPADGAGRWRQEALRHRRLTAPARVGSYLIVGDVQGYVHVLSPSDGRLLGFARIAKDRIDNQPVVAKGVAFVYANDGSVAAIRIGGAAASAARSNAGSGEAIQVPATENSES